MLSVVAHFPILPVTEYVVVPVGLTVGFFRFGLFMPAVGVHLNRRPSELILNLTESVRQIVVSGPALRVTKLRTSTKTESTFTQPGAEVRVA
jgi:hypothetical protein